jgi:hypothetical protein
MTQTPERVSRRASIFGASLVLLWLPFGLACLVAVPIALTGLLAWLASARAYDYTKNLLGGMDRCAAALLGLEARYTVSAHCGVLTRPWLGLLRALLDAISPGHCEGAAHKEGLL